jgi:hypothetical protein
MSMTGMRACSSRTINAIADGLSNIQQARVSHEYKVLQDTKLQRSCSKMHETILSCHYCLESRLAPELLQLWRG